MPDSKITALTALTAADPANDMFPVVDVSDTTMAASGTTKRISINNILACSPSATLASATITGDLTVDTNVLKVDTTNNRVGIGTASPIAGSSLDVRGAVGTGTDIQSLTLIDTSALAINNGGGLSFGYVFQSPSTVIGRAGYIKTIKENATDGNYASAMVFGVTANGASTAERYRIGSDGTSTWSVAGSTAMTLNSTGLGVGTAPANDKLLSLGSIGILLPVANVSDFNFRNSAGTVIQRLRYTDSTGGLTIGSATATAYPVELGGDTVSRAVIIDGSKNVGIGVTPSAKLDVALVGTGTPRIKFTSESDNPIIETQRFSGTASNYFGERLITGNGFLFQCAPSAAVGSQTFTTRMTLDASGRLILLASTTTPATLATNGQLTFTATSDTNLRFSYRGSDGTTRVANITLA